MCRGNRELGCPTRPTFCSLSSGRRAIKRNARPRCLFRKGACEITRKTRRQCQACRLRKCLESGMRKESEQHTTWTGVGSRAAILGGRGGGVRGGVRVRMCSPAASTCACAQEQASACGSGVVCTALSLSCWRGGPPSFSPLGGLVLSGQGRVSPFLQLPLRHSFCSFIVVLVKLGEVNWGQETGDPWYV